jgi:hypothetical protein
VRRPLFVATVAANAALLFAVEPLVSKRVLPLFGGAPSVWNTCLMAFQALLFVGYLYAHAIARRLGTRAQIGVHLALFAASLAALPPLVRNAAPPAGWPPAAWLLVLLLGAIGAPFIVLAAGAPLLQRWFGELPGRPEPYFLYAASNAGSMLALLAYPLLVEPSLGLDQQARWWGAGYAALGIGLAGCGLLVWRAREGTTDAAPVAPPAARAVSARDRLTWMALAFVPSSLLLGVTRYVTTDVAPVPLLWVVPLALYLLTFIVAFSARGRVPSDLLGPIFAGSLPLLALLTTLGVNRPLWAIAGVHVVVVGIASLVCHQALADRRPAPERLTEYFLWISLGGLLGGAFNALVAPVIFDTIAEYPLAMAFAALAWALGEGPSDADPPRSVPTFFGSLPELAVETPPTRTERILWLVGPPLIVAGLLYAAVAVRGVVPSVMRATGSAALGVPAALLCFAIRRRRLSYALCVCGLLAGAALGRQASGGQVLLQARSFFGAYTVRVSDGFHTLQNGTTLHGAQDARPGRAKSMLTYYHVAGPLGTLIAQVPSLADPARPRRVAVVGLGAGTVACYGRPGERWTFYEIDPLIARIARDPRFFTYLRDCPPTTDVVLGDARIALATAPDSAYDLIVLDAFSSDAIPTHLLTRESLALYLSKLARDGVIAIHVSNRYLNLIPVIAELALDARVAGSQGRDVSGAWRTQGMVSASVWVAVARRAATLGPLTRQPGWLPLPPAGDVRLWTDDFTDVLSVVRWH